MFPLVVQLVILFSIAIAAAAIALIAAALAQFLVVFLSDLL